MVESARLESVYTAKPYRGFESLPLRHFNHLRHSRGKLEKSKRALTQEVTQSWGRIYLDRNLTHAEMYR